MSRPVPTTADMGALAGLITRLGIEEVLNLTAGYCVGQSNDAQVRGHGDRSIAWDYVGTYLSALADKTPMVLK